MLKPARSNTGATVSLKVMTRPSSMTVPAIVRISTMEPNWPVLAMRAWPITVRRTLEPEGAVSLEVVEPNWEEAEGARSIMTVSMGDGGEMRVAFFSLPDAIKFV